MIVLKVVVNIIIALILAFGLVAYYRFLRGALPKHSFEDTTLEEDDKKGGAVGRERFRLSRKLNR